MLILLIVGIILVVLGIITGIRYVVNPVPTFFVSFGFMFIVFVMIELGNKNKPSAMDVYKGKTTLKITYKDGVPIDSVVVFKDKEK